MGKSFEVCKLAPEEQLELDKVLGEIKVKYPNMDPEALARIFFPHFYGEGCTVVGRPQFCN